MSKIVVVDNLINELQKLDKSRCILIGDDDKYGRNDVSITTILRKQHGYDESNDFYYVLSGMGHTDGCIKY